MNLPPAVTPEQATTPDAEIQLKATTLVNYINSRLRNMLPGETKTIQISTDPNSIVWGLVKAHFETYWNVVNGGHVDDNFEINDPGYTNWKFSPKMRPGSYFDK